MHAYTGLSVEVRDALKHHHEHLRRLVYVSCDPATLKRDLTYLRPEYVLEKAHGYDMFPQTTHVETVVRLSSCRRL